MRQKSSFFASKKHNKESKTVNLAASFVLFQPPKHIVLPCKTYCFSLENVLFCLARGYELLFHKEKSGFVNVKTDFSRCQDFSYLDSLFASKTYTFGCVPRLTLCRKIVLLHCKMSERWSCVLSLIDVPGNKVSRLKPWQHEQQMLLTPYVSVSVMTVLMCLLYCISSVYIEKC